MIPAYNEEKTIGQVIKGVQRVLDQHDIFIIVGCDRCSDNTGKIAVDLGAYIFETSKPGLANAYKEEVEIALGTNPDCIVHIDSDGQYYPDDISNMLPYIGQYDFVLGNRIHHWPIGLPTNKFILNRIGSFGYSIMLWHWLNDVTSGLRIFTPKVARLPILSQYTFTQEQLWRSVKAGYSIKFTPISFKKRQDQSRLMGKPWDYIRKSWPDFWRFSRDQTVIVTATPTYISIAGGK